MEKADGVKWRVVFSFSFFLSPLSSLSLHSQCFLLLPRSSRIYIHLFLSLSVYSFCLILLSSPPCSSYSLLPIPLLLILIFFLFSLIPDTPPFLLVNLSSFYLIFTPISLPYLFPLSLYSSYFPIPIPSYLPLKRPPSNYSPSSPSVYHLLSSPLPDTCPNINHKEVANHIYITCDNNKQQ